MKIRDLRAETGGTTVSVRATVEWEDAPHSPLEVYFQTSEEFRHALSTDYHAFLVASVLAAMRHGEQRVWVDGSVCPVLRDGLAANMTWVRRWYDQSRRPVRIEARSPSCPRLPPPARAGLFLSGGVDSLAALRWNRLHVPPSHPTYMNDGLWVCGFEIEEPTAFDLVTESVRKVADDAGLTLIPVDTNVRALEPDWIFWRDEAQGAYLSSVAHALSARSTSVSIAGTFDIPNMAPWGSHPLLDPNYSSCRLVIRHDGAALSRLQKTSLLVDWDVALANLRVCNQTAKYRSGALNCGECEKCTRTMLALLALGVLGRSSAFTSRDLAEDVVAGVYINDPYVESCYRDLLPALKERGRDDLVRGVTRAVTRYRGRHQLDWKTRIVRFDRRYLGGHMRKLKRVVFSQEAE